MNIAEIQSAYWQLSNIAPGEVVEGLDDINQCVQNIISTQIGSDPLRPGFGTDIFSYIDKPIYMAAPNIQREIIEALTAWEERINIIQVPYEIEGTNIIFAVAWEASGVRATTRTKLIQVPTETGNRGIGYWKIEFDFVVS